VYPLCNRLRTLSVPDCATFFCITSTAQRLLTTPTKKPLKRKQAKVHFTEDQYGVLASLAFTTLFAVASLGAGIASGRYNRKLLTVVAAVGWGVATLGTSLSSTRLCSAIITS
jgi:hypothetical protein